MAQKYTEFEQLPNGNLRITLLPAAREDVQEIVANQQLDADGKLAEVIEWQLGNGWELLSPESIGALTSAPILSEDVERDEHGDVITVGTTYWYRQYEVLDPVEQVLQHGYVDFERGA